MTLAVRCSGSPAQNRGGPASAVKAIAAAVGRPHRRADVTAAGGADPLGLAAVGVDHIGAGAAVAARPSLRSLANAITLPSGDQAGAVSFQRPWVRRRGRPPL